MRAGKLQDDALQPAGALPAQVFVTHLHHVLTVIPAAHEVRPREAGIGPREAWRALLGKGPLDELGEVHVDVVVVPERELSAGPLYLEVVAPFVRKQVLVVPRDHHVPPIPPDDDHVLHPQGLRKCPCMTEGRSTGKRFLGNGTPRARPSICPTQVPPDFGYSLTMYRGMAPDNRCTMPILRRAFDSPEILWESFTFSVYPILYLPVSSRYAY